MRYRLAVDKFAGREEYAVLTCVGRGGREMGCAARTLVSSDLISVLYAVLYAILSTRSSGRVLKPSCFLRSQPSCEKDGRRVRVNCNMNAALETQVSQNTKAPRQAHISNDVASPLPFGRDCFRWKPHHGKPEAHNFRRDLASLDWCKPSILYVKQILQSNHALSGH